MAAETDVIDPRTAIGAVRLRVGDLDELARFYEDVIGLELLERSSALARLGAGGRPLVELLSDPNAPPRPPQTTGLFHLAILVPDRRRLGTALRRVAEAGWGLTGASDHLVSEALYTSDPEGNGIEIYRDRPSEDWPRADGQPQMDTLPLDLSSVLAEAEAGEPGPMAAETRIGHVHLNVSDIPGSEAFYSGLLGFEPTVRGYPGALFVSAGGYHHHLGLNTWVGEGAPPPPEGSRGLESFEVLVPTSGGIDAIAGRLEGAGVAVDQANGGIEVSDPSSNRVAIRVADGGW
jgi:catechol 2,3-dioxygenase